MLWLTLFSAVSFLYYGVSCLLSVYMVDEFDRYGLAGYRVLVGWLQLLGAMGLLIGLLLPGVGFIAACGLALLMLMGLGVRLRIRDGLIQSSPAFLYMVLNLGLAVSYLVGD